MMGKKRFAQILGEFVVKPPGKLALVPEYGLRGASYWNVMRWFPQNWLVLNSLYDIRRAP